MMRAWLTRAGEWLNPVLVKEVRQAVRGKYFRTTFALTLSAAISIALVLMITNRQGASESHSGIKFFTAMMGCLLAAVAGLVPFASFLSMGAEWDENTFDLLTISNLRPRQIVIGKLLSAGTVALLYYSAFGPFLVFAFLLRGVDLVGMLLLLGESLVFSLCVTAVAISISSLTRVKFLRIVLMAAVAAGLVMLTSGAVTLTMFALSESARRHELVVLFLGLDTFLLSVAALALAVACTRLAHPEENRSTGLRLLTTLLTCVVIGWLVYLRTDLSGMYHDVAAALIVPLSLPFLLFTTESETLPRRVRLHLPRNRWLAALASPWLPGGASGMLLFLLHLGIFWAAVLWLETRYPAAGRFTGRFAVATSYLLVYLAIIPTLMTGMTDALRGRIAARSLVVCLFAGGILLPTLYGFFTNDEDLKNLSHWGNPVWAVEHASLLGRWLLPTMAAGALAINGVRLMRYERHVLHHAHAKR